MSLELMAPIMFGGLVVFLLLGYPVAFSLAFTLLALQGVSEVIKRVAFLKGLIPYPVEHHKQEPA